jgi:hypothetical protein
MDDLVTVFKRHADDCRETARQSNDRTRRAAWEAMAERWASAAEHQKALARVARGGGSGSDTSQGLESEC